MKKYFLTCSYYSNDPVKENLFNTYGKPQINKFCELHNFKYIDINEKNFSLVPLFDGLTATEKSNKQFYRWHVIKTNLDQGILKDGDIVNYIDSDVFIVKPEELLQTNKSFTYAIDSGNTHCTGVFSLKINDFTRRLINGILDKERHKKLIKKYIFCEHDYKDEIFYFNDQHAYYHLAGIKPHSWTSFFELENSGFHSLKNEDTVFTLDELKENVEILGPEWNCTHLLEETGVNGVHNKYDIVRTTKDKVIYRHFAGGQEFRFAEYAKK